MFYEADDAGFQADALRQSILRAMQLVPMLDAVAQKLGKQAAVQALNRQETKKKPCA